MTNNSRLLIGLLMAMPGMAHALGLGDIKLGSALNQPLVAEIELVGATAEELQQLRAGLASRESFERYGIERAPSLSALAFRVTKDASGRNVLEVRSQEAITEPFLTFLVEVNWPRGRLIREYTVLLDPPVFEEKPTPAPALAAPRTGEPAAPAAGAVTRTPPPVETTPAPAPVVETPAEPRAAGEYTVVAGDTLSGIARAQGAGTRGEIDRLMIAIYRANPQAFAGNINRLNRGAVLRIPGAADVEGLTTAEARAEVRRQMAEWRGASATVAGGGEPARLRLVTPSEPVEGVGTAPAPAPAEAPAPATAAPAAAPTAEQQAADAKRLLDLRNEELARLQAQTQQAPATPPADAAAVAPPADPAAAPADAAATPPAPVAEATAPAAPPPAARPAAPEPEQPGLLQTLTDNLLYVLLGGLALLLAAVFGMRFLKRRREAETEDAFRTLERGDSAPVPTLSTTARIPRDDFERSHILVEESADDSGEFEAPPLAPAAAAPRTALRPEPARSADDTMSSETALNLEQADPLAEADFHMAYGLYDQAADIVKLAIGREPARRDLKLKLLEVYFVWGNKDAFLDVARELGRTRDQSAADEWDKVVIMGRQIAGDDPLFAGSTGRATDVDLDLEAGGTAGVDLELLGETDADIRATQRRAAGDDVDLDLGQALGGGALDDTGEAQRLDADLDLLLDDNRRAATRAESPTVEQPTLRTGGTTREMTPRFDSPTVEQPALGRASFTGESPTIESPALGGASSIRQKIDSALSRDGRVGEATEELSLDDLGFDVDKLNSTGVNALDAGEHPADAPTMVAGLDDRSRAMLRDAERRAAARGDVAPTRELPKALDDVDATQLAPAYGATQQLPRGADPGTGTVRALGAGDLDLDLDELARALENDTIEQPRRDDARFSADVFGGGEPRGRANGANGLNGLNGAHGAARRAPEADLDFATTLADREPTVTERIAADELALPELEPVTLSEVGTKLDLARAYMDMGDPDGARSILQEVLGEGSASQKQEAQRLIETLPG